MSSRFFRVPLADIAFGSRRTRGGALSSSDEAQ